MKNKMAIIRKIIAAGKTSRAVILPKHWLDNFENEVGHPIDYVSIEIGQELRITPVIQKEVKKRLPK